VNQGPKREVPWLDFNLPRNCVASLVVARDEAAFGKCVRHFPSFLIYCVPGFRHCRELQGSPLDFGALDKRIGQRAIARKNQCNLGKTLSYCSSFGPVHQAGTARSYTISSVVLQEMKMPSSAQLSVPVF